LDKNILYPRHDANDQNTAEEYLSHAKIISQIIFTMLFISIFCSIVYFELNFFKETRYVGLRDNQVDLYVVLMIYATTIISLALIPLRRYYTYLYKALLKMDSNYFMLSFDFKMMWFDLICVVVVPLPMLNEIIFENFNSDNQILTYYRANHIMCLLMLLRLFVMFDIYLRSLPYASLRMHKFLKLSNLDENLMFIIKCLIKKNPYIFFVVSLLISILVFSYSIRLCELPLAIKLNSESFQSYMLTIWMIMITMTTVGYGDYAPKTISGRVLGFFLCIWGIFLMSMIVVILFQSLELSYEEKQALVIFNKLEAKKPLTKAAAEVITEVWIMKKRKQKNSKLFEEKIQEFKRLQKQLKILDSVKYDYFFEKLNLYFESMSHNIQEMSQTQNKLLMCRQEIGEITQEMFKKTKVNHENVKQGKGFSNNIQNL
jgi:hypothetical protein